MKQVDHVVAARLLATVRRHSWLSATLVLICCGGKSTTGQASNAGSAAGRSGGGSVGSDGGAPPSGQAGGTEIGIGGEHSDGGQNITVGAGGMLAAGGADLPGGAAGGPDMSCDSGKLLMAIRQGAVGGLGTCEFAPPPADGENVGLLRGAVVLDSEGRVIDNTGLQAMPKQAWLDQLMNQRWLCLGGQTLGYKCRAAG